MSATLDEPSSSEQENRPIDHENRSKNDIEIFDPSDADVIVCAQTVVENYLGQPSDPFTATVEELREYLDILIEDLRDIDKEALKSKPTAGPQPRRVSVNLMIKEVKFPVPHKHLESYEYAFCRVWIGNSKPKFTESVLNKDRIWWNQGFKLDIHDYDSDLINVEVWVSKTPNMDDARKSPKMIQSGSLYKKAASKLLHVAHHDTVQLVGSISQAVKEFPCVPEDMSLPLIPTDDHKDISAELEFFVEFIGKRSRADVKHLELHTLLLKICHENHISKLDTHFSWKSWSEMLPFTGITLAHQHAIQYGITPAEEILAAWILTTTFKRHGEDRISYTLFRKLLEDMHRYKAHYPLEDGLTTMFYEAVDVFMSMAWKDLEKMHEEFDCLKKENVELFDFLSCIFLANPNQEDQMQKAEKILEKDSWNFYYSLIRENKPALNVENPADAASVVETLKDIVKKYIKNQIYLDVVFESVWGISYSATCRAYLNTAVITFVKTAITQIVELKDYAIVEDKKVLMNLLQLFHTIRNLIEYVETRLPEELKSTLSMTGYPRWFGEHTVLKWFLLSAQEAAPFIQRAVELDKMEPLDAVAKHGTSVADVINIIEDLVMVIWMKMPWEDQLFTHGTLVEAINTSAVNYVQYIMNRLQNENFFSPPDKFEMTAKLCVALSNVHTCLLQTYDMGSKISEVIAKAEAMYAFSLIDETPRVKGVLVRAVTKVFELSFEKFGHQFSILFKSVVIVAEDEKAKKKAITSLCNLVENTLEIMYNCLEHRLFNLLLHILWSTLIHLLIKLYTKSTTFADFVLKWKIRVKIVTTPVLDNLESVFHANGNGLSKRDIKSGSYEDLRHVLMFGKLPTENKK